MGKAELVFRDQAIMARMLPVVHSAWIVLGLACLALLVPWPRTRPQAVGAAPVAGSDNGRDDGRNDSHGDTRDNGRRDGLGHGRSDNRNDDRGDGHNDGRGDGHNEVRGDGRQDD